MRVFHVPLSTSIVHDILCQNLLIKWVQMIYFCIACGRKLGLKLLELYQSINQFHNKIDRFGQEETPLNNTTHFPLHLTSLKLPIRLEWNWPTFTTMMVDHRALPHDTKMEKDREYFHLENTKKHVNKMLSKHKFFIYIYIQYSYNFITITIRIHLCSATIYLTLFYFYYTWNEKK